MKCLMSLGGVTVLSAILCLTAVGQEKEKAKEKKPPRPALPRFVGDVLTEEQRAKAYKIAELYEPDLDKLRAEMAKATAALDAAKKHREKEIEALLSEAQKKRIKELDAEVKAESEKIAALVKQQDGELRKVREKRDQEIDALLTAEQRARVKELTAQSKSSTAANKKAKASATAKKEPAKEAPKETTPKQ